MLDTDQTHETFVRLQTIRKLISLESRKLRTGEADGHELDLLFAAEDRLQELFETLRSGVRTA